MALLAWRGLVEGEGEGEGACGCWASDTPVLSAAAYDVLTETFRGLDTAGGTKEEEEALDAPPFPCAFF